MGGKGRGRGESKSVEKIDDIDVRVEEDRQQQLEAARLLGIPEGEIPIRGRGGFRQAELRTIPENITEVRTRNLQAFQPIDILCNYVPINPMQGRIIHMYRVDFSPEIESASLMRKLFNVAAASTFTARPIYDGVHECRSGQKLAEQTTQVSVSLQDASDASYQVTFAHTGTAQWGAEMLRLYNTQMKDFLRKMGYYSPQPGLFVHPNQVTQVSDDIMMLRGFSTSANLHENSKMLMNFNAAHKLVQKKNVLQIMAQIRSRSPPNLQEAVRAELTGKLVVTSYDHRPYRIENVDFTTNPNSTFLRKTGGPITFREYYQTVHSLTIRDLGQPLLVVTPNNNRRREQEGDAPEIKLIPELCNIAGLTDAQRNDGRLRRDLITASQINPNDRVNHLRQFLEEFHRNTDIKNQLQAWGYSYDKEPVKIKGHVLPPTMVGFGQVAQTKAPGEWARSNPSTADFNVTGLAVTPTMNKMVILVPRLRNPAERGTILGKLKQGFDRIGFRFRDDIVTITDMNGDSPTDYISHLRNIPSDTTVTIVVMARQNKERYNAIKKAASCEMGRITQVVTAQLLCDERKSGGAATKIAIQVAAKIGGEPWWVDIPVNFGAMVCGYDTYHDTAQRGRSFGAFIASMNNRYSRWYSKADAHDRLDEISTQVSANMRAALSNYRKLNNKFPERVIIYRDGVGEGQLEHVFKIEMNQINEAIKSVDPNIKLTVIVVNKRIGARFYMRSQQGGFNNPPPGTVIDHTVTRQERYDFYLISQSTRQGTITPTYYNIIHDEIGLPPEVYQKMAYKFCLLYYNWSGSVRVPAPCQYAHKLALLCGEHLHNCPNANLDNLLHFL